MDYLMKYLLFFIFLISPIAHANNAIVGTWDHFKIELGMWNFSRLVINEDFSSQLFFKQHLMESVFNAEPQALKFENGVLTVSFDYKDEEFFPPPNNKLVLSLALKTGLTRDDESQLVGQSVWYFENPEPTTVVGNHVFQRNGLSNLHKIVQQLTKEANKSN